MPKALWRRDCGQTQEVKLLLRLKKNRGACALGKTCCLSEKIDYTVNKSSL